jgi:N6-L-threonylcarbamoyladenine synthase/protein kinase Bud32
MNIINEGAEAQIIQINSKTLKKVRVAKPYRISQIDDRLRKARNKREFKVLKKLFEENINVPEVFDVDEKEVSFTFEFIKGENLKYVLDKGLLFKAFDNIIKIHNLDVVHGDLTTLNMLVKDDKAISSADAQERNENEVSRVYLIDFGLSEFSIKVEDKAVDLNLFFNCIKNEHPELAIEKAKLIKMYCDKVSKGKEIVKRLENIEGRGRNK